jgi:hypothetical protein
MAIKGNHRIAIDDIMYELSHRPRRSCRGPSMVQSVPGHEAVLPVGLVGWGGALG